MLTVKGMPIYVDELEILNNIKEQVLQQQGREILAKIKKSGNNIMVCCPNPEHSNGQERKPSCGITLVPVKRGDRLFNAGTYHCFGCGSNGSFEKFVSLCFGVLDEGEFGQAWLIENYVTGEEYERPTVESEETRQRPNVFKRLKKNVQYVSEEELASYRFYHPYMWKRKLTPEIVEKYDVGYQKDFLVYEDKNTGYKKYDEVLTFPCRDINGNCLFVSRRSIKGKSFYLPLNLDKPVYGVYELPKDCKEVIICESVINALTCAVYGHPALALFGTGNNQQYQQLASLPIRHYILALDPDKAGNNGTYKLKKHLLRNVRMTKLIIPPKKDINDLSYEEFMSLPRVIIH